MILECPACHAQFNVPDGAITAAGRTVKCSACAHQWHATPPVIKTKPEPAPVTPPAPVAIPQAVETTQPAVELDTSFLEELARATDAPDETIPELTPTPRVERVINPTSFAPPQKQFTFPLPIWAFKLAAPTLAVGWLALALFAYFPNWINAPVVGGIYHAMGVVPTDGVILADIAMQRQQEGQRTRFLISGNIVNHEASPREVPAVRVKMLSPQNEVIWAREYEVAKTLQPGEIYPFRITNAETSFANNVAQLVVDVGHPLQMMFR